YANERLQYHFIDFVLTQEQKRYQDEGIPWETLTVPQNEGCLEILESRPTGILALLDEECNIPKGSDAGLVRKLYQIYNNHPQFNASRRDQVEFAFIIVHYAGAVRYEAKGFCDKNRDKPHQDIFDLLSSSTNTFVSLLCRPVDVLSESIHALPPMMRRKSSLISLGLGSQFRRQLHQLLEMIALTQPHYIRCLKPNDANKKHIFHRQRMADQLRYGGVLEAVRIARLGYSVHMKHAKFIERYALLSPVAHHKVESLLKSLTTLLSTVWPYRDEEGKSHWYRYGMEIGKTLVFLRQVSYDFLEREVRLKVTKCAITVQSFARMALYRHRFHLTKTIALASQRIARGFLARRIAWRQRSLRFLVISVQAWFRGYKQRQAWHVFKQHLCCTAIQSQWRRYSARRKYSRTLQSVIRIQGHWRCKSARRMLYQLKSEALSLKHTIQERNELRQKLAATQSEATMALQRAEQAELELKKLKSLMEKMMEDTPISQNKRVIDTGGILKSVDDMDIPYNTPKIKVVENTTQSRRHQEPVLVSDSIVDTSIAVKSLIDTMPLVVSKSLVTSEIDYDIQHKAQVKETLGALIEEDKSEDIDKTMLHIDTSPPEVDYSAQNQDTFCPVQETPSQLDKKHRTTPTPRAPMHVKEVGESRLSTNSNLNGVDNTHADHGKTDNVVLDVLDSVIEIAISANVPVVRREVPFHVGHSHAFNLPSTSLSLMDATSGMDLKHTKGNTPSSNLTVDSNPTSQLPPPPISTVDLVRRDVDNYEQTHIFSKGDLTTSSSLVPPPADSDFPIMLPRASPTSVLTRNASYLTWANLTLDNIRISIEQDHNPDNQDNSGRTMLHFGVETNNAELVDLLLSLKANPMITDFTNQETPFHVAAKLANMEISGIFCRPDILPQVDTNLPDKEGNTVLHLAAMSPRPSAAYVLELYLYMGADPNAQNVLGRTPLHICALHRRDSMLVDRLIAFGADPNIYAIDHKTPLHIAVKRGLLEQSIELVRGGASLTIPDGNKWCCITSELSKSLIPYIQHPPYMIPDQDVDACMLCKYPFNFIVRRHHCRRCGIVGCSDCIVAKHCVNCTANV
ncbi:myosin, partial [Thraustotheca clavata]